VEPRLIALKLFLDALAVPASVGTLDDRKTIQKGIYLGQRLGVDLGYRFGWYRMGPYSPMLTKDYFRLWDALVAKNDDFKRYTLRDGDRLVNARSALQKPSAVHLNQSEWLELLASLDYLREVSRLTSTEVLDVLATQKPTLVPFVDQADAGLKALDLT
jgi:uncharacterized protein YwgA